MLSGKTDEEPSVDKEGGDGPDGHPTESGSASGNNNKDMENVGQVDSVVQEGQEKEVQTTESEAVDGDQPDHMSHESPAKAKPEDSPPPCPDADGVVRRPADIVYNWKDITQEFKDGCDHLELGELMHDNSFGLFEAMSAIEMMDPKMDAGMLCNQAKRKVLGLKDSIESSTVKIRDVTMTEMAGIIDDTLACLVTWLEGHSLAQTVFTNLYLHDPYIIEDRMLKAFSICMLKLVDLIKDRINRASVFEEEDFQPMTYGFKMVGDVTDVRAAGMMKEVEDDLNRTIKNTRSKPGEVRDATTEKENEEALAVFCRMRFCRLFFLALVSLGKEKCQGVPDAKKHLAQMGEQLATVVQTLNLGARPDDSQETSQDYPTIMGFEPLINQRLLPPTFPRYTKIKSREEMMEYMKDLITSLMHVCTVTELSLLHPVMEFFSEFSKPSPCVLSRSMLQLIYLPQNRRAFGTQNMVDVLRDTIRAFILPSVLTTRGALSNNAQAKELVDAFLTHAIRPVSLMLQISGHNRARQRDKWGHLLEDLSALQDEADKVDSYLHMQLLKLEPGRQHLACFGTWVLYHTIRVMIRYTLAGFELELYAVHEYHYIYWYLHECLYSWLVSTLNRADAFLMEQENVAEQQQKGRNAKKRKKKKVPTATLR